jgi:hypothetical protein
LAHARRDRSPAETIGRAFFFSAQSQRAAWIERSTSSLGQQSTLSPADF